MIEFTKDWPKLLFMGVITALLTMMIQQCSNIRNDTRIEFKENKDDHAEIVRGCIAYVAEAKKDAKIYTDNKFDSILLLLKDVKKTQEDQQSKIDAIYSYILNHRQFK
jgi:hypothetical protein